MKVRELIQALEGYDPEFDVVEIKDDGLLYEVKQVIGMHGNNKGCVFLSSVKPIEPQ